MGLLVHPEGSEPGMFCLSDSMTNGKASACPCIGLATDTCCKLVELISIMKSTSCILVVCLSISLSGRSKTRCYYQLLVYGYITRSVFDLVCVFY
jgi:hypothetical protein